MEGQESARKRAKIVSSRAQDLSRAIATVEREISVATPWFVQVFVF